MIGISSSIGWLIFSYPNEFYFLGYYPSLSNTFTNTFLGLNQVVAFTLVIFYQLLAELVPSYIYNHAGSISVAIRKEIQEVLQATVNEIRKSKPNNEETSIVIEKSTDANLDGCKIHLVWYKYVTLRNLVKEADLIFGSLMLVDYGMKIFMICLATFSGLKGFRDAPIFEILGPLSMVAFYLVRLVTCVMSKSHLFRSREHLLTELMVTSVNTYWYDLNMDQRKVLTVFQDQAEREQLAATPMGLFSITPGILLTIAGLSMSYIIILMQS